MKIQKTKINGVFVIDPEPKVDSRGYFSRIFAKEVLKKTGIKFDIVHINRSLTVKRGTIRGLHYQKKPKQEDKIVQCLKGAIFDVAVDIRPNSKTYGKWVGIELNDRNMKMLLIPKGCAHGFQALTNNILIEYFVSEYYSPKHEKGMFYADPAFKIKWPVKKVITSDKDSSWPAFSK